MKKTDILKLSACLLIGAIASCNVSNKYYNRAEDIKAATAVVDSFYLCLKNNNPNGALKFISSENSTLNNNKIYQIFDVATHELGNIESLHADSSKTFLKEENGKREGQYFLYFTAIHERYKTNDVFKLKLENNQIRITDFKMNPSYK